MIFEQYIGENLVYKGHVLLGKSSAEFNLISRVSQTGKPQFAEDVEADVVYISPDFVSVEKYMELTGNGMLRQPVFKGLRDDKTPTECIS